MRKEIIIVGQGGQGIVLTGEMLAKAANFDGREAACSSSYGAAARGDATTSEVVISDEPIDFPGVMRLDFLVAISQEGYDKCLAKTHPGSKIFYDADTVKIIQSGKAVHIPVLAVKTASALGSRMAANMVMLGAIAAAAELVSRNSLLETVKKESGKFAEINIKAMEEGYKINKR